MALNTADREQISLLSWDSMTDNVSDAVHPSPRLCHIECKDNHTMLCLLHSTALAEILAHQVGASLSHKSSLTCLRV